MTEETKPKKTKLAAHKTLQLSQTVHSKTKGSVQGFVDFVRTQGIVGLAIGFVIGVQAKSLVDQFSASFVNPLLGLIVGTADGLTSKKLIISVDGSTAVFAWGAFVYALINFLIIAAIIYFVFKWLRLDKLDKPKS
jgi:large conductance mechanosensitive channel